MTTPAPTVEYDSPFDLPPHLHAARPYVARAIAFGRNLLQSGEKPGTRAWVWADSLRSISVRQVDRLGGWLADRPTADVLVTLHFERIDRQLRAHVHVECATGAALLLVGEAQAQLLGPWSAHAAERVTAERSP